MIDHFEATSKSITFGFIVLQGMDDLFMKSKSSLTRTDDVKELRKLQTDLSEHPRLKQFKFDLKGINVEKFEVDGKRCLLVFDVEMAELPDSPVASSESSMGTSGLRIVSLLAKPKSRVSRTLF